MWFDDAKHLKNHYNHKLISYGGSQHMLISGDTSCQFSETTDTFSFLKIVPKCSLISKSAEHLAAIYFRLAVNYLKLHASSSEQQTGFHWSGSHKAALLFRVLRARTVKHLSVLLRLKWWASERCSSCTAVALDCISLYNYSWYFSSIVCFTAAQI